MRFKSDGVAFVIVWDPDAVSAEDYAALVAALGDVVRASGGVGLERLSSRTALVSCGRDDGDRDR